VVGIIFNSGHRFENVTAAYAVSCKLDICSNNAGMVFCSKVLGMNYFQSHFLKFIFIFLNALIQTCWRHYEEWYM
jgi:hypothetical protein